MTTIMGENDLGPTDDEMDEEDAALDDTIVTVGSLADGGQVNGAQLRPMQGLQTLSKGRPAARRAWMWNGTESLLPLSWNPDGKVHDGARRYFRKRHCLCCRLAGFQGQQCPRCVKNNCDQCKGSRTKGKVIPCFYAKKEDVPFPSRLYGSINCFLEFCARRDGRGFLTMQDMILHAKTRHKLEYAAHVESQAAQKRDETDYLRERVDALTALTERLLAGQGVAKATRARRRKTKDDSK